MRPVAVLLCSTLFACPLLGLSACATHEDVRTAYAGPSAMDASQVTELLNRQGYHDIINLHRNGPDWVGSGTKDGSPVNFDIDMQGNIHVE